MIGLRELAGNQNITTDISILTPLQGGHKTANTEQKIFSISAKVSISMCRYLSLKGFGSVRLWSLASNNVVKLFVITLIMACAPLTTNYNQVRDVSCVCTGLGSVRVFSIHLCLYSDCLISWRPWSSGWSYSWTFVKTSLSLPQLPAACTVTALCDCLLVPHLPPHCCVPVAID